jgi:hypothetical protein
MKFRLLYCLAFALCIFAGTTAKAQIPQLPDDYHNDSIDKVFNGTDTDIINNILSHPRYRYWSAIACSGISVLFLNKTGGTVGAGFPYTATDATTGVTTDYTFQSQNKKIFNTINPYLNTFGVEYGELRGFGNVDLLIGLPFLSFSAGYGYSWYLNGLSEHEQNMAERRLVLRASLNFMINSNSISGGKLGSINNSNQTIQFLGYTANPKYSNTSTDDDGNVDTFTFTVKHLNVLYRQLETSLLPKISIGSNPYYHATLSKDGTHMRGRAINWELALGYNIPFYDNEKIYVVQYKNFIARNPVAKLPLNTSGLTFLYNGKPATSAPFRFSGLYLSFTFYFGRATIY